MTTLERLLNAHPYGGGGTPSDDPPGNEDIGPLLEALRYTEPLTMEDFKVVLYASYLGLDVPEIDASVLEPAFRETVRRATETLPPEAEDVVRLVVHRMLHERGWAAPPSVGWAIAALVTVGERAPQLLSTVATADDDPSHLVASYALSYFMTPAHRRAVLVSLVKSAHAVDHRLAGEVLIEALSSQITLRDGASLLAALTDEPCAPRGAIVALARVLGRAAMPGIRINLPHDDATTVAAEIATTLQRVARTLASTRSNIREMLREAQTEQIYVLGLLSQWANAAELEAVAADEVKRRGWEAFTTLFASRFDMEDGAELPLIGTAVIQPLVEALSLVGLDVEVFAEQFDGLAADRISRDASFGDWLYDRRRATALLIVAAEIVQRRNDDALREAARGRASWLATQPALEIQFDPLPVHVVKDVLGVELIS